MSDIVTSVMIIDANGYHEQIWGKQLNFKT